MANKRISSLNSLGGTPAVGDIIPITDISDTTGSAQGTTKKVTVANLVAAAPQGDLLASNNLSDVASTTTARTNLGLGSLATQSSIDGTAITSTGETGGTKFLREDGDGTCSFQAPSVDVDTPLTTALRGTTNPHLGAYANQSFRVTDNPYQTVMVVADENGNITFLLNGTSPNVFVKVGAATAQALAKGFSIQKDADEPDIEAIDTDGTPYSVISGDSDDISVSGLPRIQGFNKPDLGSYSSPQLISGGSIS